MTHDERLLLVERNHIDISLVRQAELLDVSRASLYYVPKPHSEDKLIMDCIDTIYTDYPFYGSRRIKIELFDRYEVSICREHIQRLMRVLGIEAVYPKPKPKTSLGDESHKKYPYLLSGLSITKPDQVWGTDITYIRLESGFCYLVVIMDWFSRYVIAWRLSETLESHFCIEALQDALLAGVPDIHNSAQGSQYASIEYTGILEDYEIAISMDARGRCFDNIFTERLWRTVKYENVYLQSYRTIEDAKIGLTEYFNFYNRKRKHQALGYRTPDSLYMNH
mgnify:CR=1 FL=1